jgi:integrase/recombinase XerD
MLTRADLDLALAPDDAGRFRLAIEDVLSRLRSEHSRRAYLADWRSWVAWCDRHGRWILAVTPGDVQAYLRDAAACGAAGKTVNRHLTTLRQVYGALAVHGLVAANPAREVRAPRVDRAPHAPWLTAGEVERLVRAVAGDRWIDRRDRLMLLLLVGCGLRRAEVASLRASSFQRLSPGGRWAFRVAVKNGKQLTAGVPQALAGPLEAWLAERAHLGPNGGLWSLDGSTLSGDAVYEVVARAARAAGLEDKATPHALRRTFATLASLAGAELRAIQAALGHSRATTTEGYIRDVGVPAAAAGDAFVSVLEGALRR